MACSLDVRSCGHRVGTWTRHAFEWAGRAEGPAAHAALPAGLDACSDARRVAGGAWRVGGAGWVGGARRAMMPGGSGGCGAAPGGHAGTAKSRFSMNQTSGLLRKMFHVSACRGLPRGWAGPVFARCRTARAARAAHTRALSRRVHAMPWGCHGAFMAWAPPLHQPLLPTQPGRRWRTVAKDVQPRYGSSS